MKKSILNLGKALNKEEQKTVNGGMFLRRCSNIFFCALDCLDGDVCAYPSSTGEIIRGYIQNGLCC